MTEIDQIPADQTVVMTATLERAFKAAGCDPTCHCCQAEITIGEAFKLAMIDATDEMLCDNCTPHKLKHHRTRALTRELNRKAARREYDPVVTTRGWYGGSGYSRPHRGSDHK